jgi:hypothetical protein
MNNVTFKVGDLVQIKHREHHGLFVLMKNAGKGQMWVQIFSLKERKVHHELVYSLEWVA